MKNGNQQDKPVLNDPQRPLSAWSYLVVAVLGLLLASAFTIFYVNNAPQLVAHNVQGQIYYLLLIPWALSSAAFLFGAMKSYARFTHRHLGNVLELGGPVVLFGLVLIGGFRLVPAVAETIDLAVRAHSEDVPLITSGQVTLDLPGLPHAQIGPDGEASFKGISAQFKGKSIKVLVQTLGFEESWRTPTVEGDVLDVAVERVHNITVLNGSLDPPPVRWKAVTILVDGQNAKTSPDDLGKFTLNVNGKAGDRVRLKVYEERRLVYDDYQVLPGPVIVSMMNR